MFLKKVNLCPENRPNSGLLKVKKKKKVTAKLSRKRQSHNHNDDDDYDNDNDVHECLMHLEDSRKVSNPT